jgi:hypothetical protein
MGVVVLGDLVAGHGADARADDRAAGLAAAVRQGVAKEEPRLLTSRQTRTLCRSAWAADGRAVATARAEHIRVAVARILLRTNSLLEGSGHARN